MYSSIYELNIWTGPILHKFLYAGAPSCSTFCASTKSSMKSFIQNDLPNLQHVTKPYNCSGPKGQPKDELKTNHRYLGVFVGFLIKMKFYPTQRRSDPYFFCFYFFLLYSCGSVMIWDKGNSTFCAVQHHTNIPLKRIIDDHSVCSHTF